MMMAFSIIKPFITGIGPQIYQFMGLGLGVSLSQYMCEHQFCLSHIIHLSFIKNNSSPVTYHDQNDGEMIHRSMESNIPSGQEPNI